MWYILSIFFKYDRLEIICALGWHRQENIFKICETFPNSIKLLLHSLVEFLDYQLVNNIILFINVIICLSYPLNFAIYCGMSRSSILFMNPFLNEHQIPQRSLSQAVPEDFPQCFPLPRPPPAESLCNFWGNVGGGDGGLDAEQEQVNPAKTQIHTNTQTHKQ